MAFHWEGGGCATNLNSLPYVLFLLCISAIHGLLRPRLRNGFLLFASYLFYLLCAPRFLPLLLAATVWNYALARTMDRAPGRRKLLLLLGLAVNLGALFLFKYLGFFAGLAESLAGRPLFSLPKLLLPAGISFYTFAVCGYLIDVCRGRQRAERSFWDFALFVSFFPAVLSGPIERAGHLLPQLKTHKLPGAGVTGDDVKDGALRFLVGLCKKMVIADQLAILVNTAYAAPADFTGFQLLAASLAYSVQIYCDFSAYSDMAIGSARLLGIRLLENFDAPYLSRSVKEFWRRWHISLSSWFRDYLYFPLGGSRRGRGRTYINIMIVFAVSGLWHGAAITFVLWGLLNGAYQVAGSLLAPIKSRLRTAMGLREGAPFLSVLQIGMTFLLTTAAWIFFRAGSISQARLVLRRIGTMAGGIFPFGLTALGLSKARLAAVLLSVSALFLTEIFRKRLRLWERFQNTTLLRYAVYVALFLAILIFGAYGPGYNAQEFVYFQF